MINRRTFSKALVAGAAVSLAATGGFAATAKPDQARNVVLVHGLFADGSCWLDVLARLQGHGLNATSVQNPLTTLEESVESAKRVLDRQDGPTVLVGHSFGGMLVSEAGVHRQRRPSRFDEIQVDVGLSTHPNNWKNRENWRCPSLC